MTSDKRYLTIRLPIDERERLEKLATENDRSLSAEVRRAIREHLKTNIRPTA